jgi:DNA-binding FadR family transcriptional regulator
VPFQAVATQRLYEQVAGQVTDLVTRGEFKPGDRLPPERDLARMLGVSRPTVREAMIALEIAGLVEVRVGAGAFITDRAAVPTDAPRLDSTGASPLQAIAARRMIEPPVAALAARMADKDDLAGIAETFEMMRHSAGTPAHRAADRLFHARIAAATKNEVLAAIVDGIWAELFTPMFERMGTRSGLVAQERSEIIVQHDAVYRALVARDGAGAAEAMDRHLSITEHILAEGEAHETEPVKAAGGAR